MRIPRSAALWALCAACASPETSEAERGRALFESTAFSPSGINVYSCSTCHAEYDTDPSARMPGAPMAGVTYRPSFWGGQENQLLRAVNACRREFMVAPLPLVASDPNASLLWAYLRTLEPGQANPIPFSVVRTISSLPRGDAERGQPLFASACAPCHGAMHTGVGRLGERIPTLPEDTVRDHAEFTARVVRLVFIEKVRHGSFFGYGGDMPPFSLEVLGDAPLSDLLEALGVLGE